MSHPGNTPDRARRLRWDGVRIVVASALFVLSGALATTPPPVWEESLFRFVNELPRQLEYLLLPVQQTGMVLALPVGALFLWWVIREWRSPTGLLVGGLAFGWGAAKLVKEFVGRERPSAFYDPIQLGIDAPTVGLGFPSGHAVVAFTLATVLSPYLSRWQRWLVYGLALATCVARVFNGAHLPLDVTGGALFGTLVGSSINLVMGINRDRATMSLPPESS